MFRRTVVIMSVFFLTSCTASMKTTPPSQSAKVNREANEANREGQMKTEIAAVSETAQEEMQAAIGLIFAKTIFEGIVKTSYVELAIVDQSDESKKFQLIIGDKERQKNFPWEVQAVKPGYFFIELPEGQYRIKSMSIPVGTTKAQEPIDIVFDVTAKQATYLGTLKVSGTKEKIKLGGVPVQESPLHSKSVCTMSTL